MKTNCIKCGLNPDNSKVRVPSVIPSTGAEIAFIAEAPGEKEEIQGIPLVGAAGINFNSALQQAGIDRSKVYVGNICICRPTIIGSTGKKKNRAPTREEMTACYPRLYEELKQVKPRVIVTLGLTASKMILQDHKIKMDDAHGRVYDGTQLMGFPCKIVPTWHPSPVTFSENSHRLPQLFHDVKYAYKLLSGEGIKKKDWVEITILNYVSWNLVFEILKNADMITFDLETTGLDIYAKNARITNIGFTSAPGYGISVVCENWPQDEFNKFLNDIKWLMDTKNIVAHYMTFDAKYMMEKWNIWPKKWYWDTSLGHSVIKSGDSNKLSDIVWHYTDMGNYKGKINEFGGLLKSTALERVEYNIGDVVSTHRIAEKQISMLTEQNRIFLMREIMMPASEIFAEMEYRGVKIDIFTLKNLTKIYRQKLQDLKNNMYLHGTIMAYNRTHSPFNPNSNPQIAKILFDKEYCGYVHSKKTAKDQKPATDKEVLNDLADTYKSDICKMLLEYSQLSKIYTTYLEGMEKKLVGDRIHTHYRLDIAVTGRTSSKDVNLQNVSKDSDIKSMFVSDTGFSFIDLDYKQMELAVSTYYTHDPIMIEAVKSGDAHSYIGKLIFGQDVTEENRRFIKTLNFGVLYGMGHKKLARQLKIEQEEAKRLINEYFDLLKLTGEWIKSKRVQAEKNGLVASKFGRIRHYPKKHEVAYDNSDDDRETYNSAVNHPIQSCASDIVLYAMGLWKKYLVSRGIYGKDAYMSLQVHDNVVTSVREELVTELLQAKKRVFESVSFPFMTLPLTTEISHGYTWGNLTKVNM